MSRLVLSQIDYANCLFSGLPHCELLKLQRVQNFAARVVLGLQKHDSVRSQLRDLHWLNVKFRIDHKVASLVFKCLNNQAPPYLSGLLTEKKPSDINLRSNFDNLRLIVPKTKHKTFADRSFSVYGPKIWNDIPYSIRASKNLNSFKKSLKTHYFSLMNGWFSVSFGP